MPFVAEGQALVRLCIWTEAPATQGLQNSAQGLNPGDPQNKRFALKALPRSALLEKHPVRRVGGAEGARDAGTR